MSVQKKDSKNFFEIIKTSTKSLSELPITKFEI